MRGGTRLRRGGKAARGGISPAHTPISENLIVNIFGDYTSHLTITIDNGDDPPISFDRVQPQSLERRLYFEPQGKRTLKLYYGDDKLSSPVYDYAKFFREDPNAAVAELAPEMSNSTHAGRPDDRPWSERHRIIVWASMILAV